MTSELLRRRQFVRNASAWAALMVASLGPIKKVHAQKPLFINDPFQLGVASGDPVADGFVIWTRIAPDPYDINALPNEALLVTWEVAADAKFKKIIKKGNIYARPELAHSVHVEVQGLDQGREYFYRFTCGDVQSQVGRALTLPAPYASVDRLKFGVASCQHYEQGYFTAYKDMIAHDPSLIVHLGDYIYDVSWGQTIRHHPIGDARTLHDYRQIHAVYKLDADLQKAHLHCPWVFVWDDHEVDNDYADLINEDNAAPEVFAKRRNAAYQAFYEHMPLRAMSAPDANMNMIMFQRFQYGNLAEFNLLDLRQYRSNQPCELPDFFAGRVVDETQCPDWKDPKRTMLGPLQETWMSKGFARTNAKWVVLAQSLMLMGYDQTLGPTRGFYTDNWNAYPFAKRRLLDLIKLRKLQNVISLGGDIHAYFVGDVKDDDLNPNSPTLISEFVGTSVTSESYNTKLFNALMAENPQMKFVDDRYRGYIMCDVTPTVWNSTLRIVDNVHTRDGTFRTLAAFAVENGKPGVQMA
jgi:alkaline phosphatase D